MAKLPGPLPLIQSLLVPNEDVKTLVLDLHNKFRKDHFAPPLTLDLNLCEEATKYAHCVASGTNPQINLSLGHNIYKIETSANCLKEYNDLEAIREAVTSWWGHWRQYNWRSPCASPKVTQRFCQVVWKCTIQLGVGVVTKVEGDGRKLIVVCVVYSPAANLKSNQSHFENVSPPDI